ncbi:MAG: hypothetical protein ABEK12_01375, partial [Candidatus Nanohaloarchaea archaeon]
SPVGTAVLAGTAMRSASIQAIPATALLAVHIYYLVRLRPGGGTAEREGVRLAELAAGPVPALMEELHRRFRD